MFILYFFRERGVECSSLLTAERCKGEIYLVYYLTGLPEWKTTGGKANKINMQRISTLGAYNFLVNGFTLRMKQHRTIPISF